MSFPFNDNEELQCHMCRNDTWSVWINYDDNYVYFKCTHCGSVIRQSMER